MGTIMRQLSFPAVVGFALAAVASLSSATDLTPTVIFSVDDNFGSQSFNSTVFHGLIRKQSLSYIEDRAMQEFDASAFAGGLLQSATLSGTVFVNNAFDVGVRSFDFILYAGNGAADLGDFQIAGTVVGTGSYHPPMQTSFTYNFDVTSAAQSLISGGATWIGLRVQSSSDPNYPDILDDMTSLLAIVGTQATGTPFCAGDGSATACPCGNSSPAGAQQGCLNSLGVGGRLVGSGVASVANDTFRLDGTNLTNSSVLFFQGSAQLNGGLGLAFGDGLRCAGGTIIRLGTKVGSGGAAHYPETGDLSVSQRGLIPASGGTFTYQAWYRNAAAFCTASTFNLTNGWSVNWTP